MPNATNPNALTARPCSDGRRPGRPSREMIEQRNSLNWIGKYFTNVLFVLAGGVLTWIAFGEQVLKAIKMALGIH